jgi:hypothetical protein
LIRENSNSHSIIISGQKILDSNPENIGLDLAEIELEEDIFINCD